MKYEQTDYCAHHDRIYLVGSRCGGCERDETFERYRAALKEIMDLTRGKTMREPIYKIAEDALKEGEK